MSVPAFVLAAALAAHAQQQPTGTWSTTNPNGSAMPQGWQYYYSTNGMASDGTYLYVVGGYQYNYPYNYSWPNYYSTTRRYDPAGNTWITLAYLTTPIYGGNTAAYLNGCVYNFGSSYYGNGWISRYDITYNYWTILSPSLTNNRYYASAAALNGKIYITGGGFPSNLVDEFDPAANGGSGSITARATMSQARYRHACAAIPSLGKLYVAGGYNNGYIATCEEYTPPGAAQNANTWRTMAPMTLNNVSATRYGPIAFSLVDRLYVVGGQSNNGYQNTTLELHPLNGPTGTWTQRASMTYTRSEFGGAAHGTDAAYVFGGNGNGGYQILERFTPPDFGLPPDPPTGVQQAGSRPETALQAQADTNQLNGWTNNQIAFSANITDPNAGQQVRFVVQVKPQNAPWTQTNQITNLATPLGPQGTHTVSFAIPAGGGYDWRWRAEDAYANTHPAQPGTWIEAFGTEATPNTASPDFRSDQAPPSDPVANAPHNIDIQVPDPVSGDVPLYWTESTDNGPTAGISYELQVATDGGFLQIEAQIFSPAGTSSYPVALKVSRYEKYWRVRASDIGGNMSSWSAAKSFRVTHNDGIDHGGGDAKKTCGFSASAIGAPWSALLCLMILGLASRKKLS